MLHWQWNSVKVNPGSSFIQILLSLIYLCCMTSFKIISIPEKKFLKLFTIYGRSVHLGHVTSGIYSYTNFRSQVQRRLRLKIGFD